MKEENFTASQVAALIEDLQGQFQVVVEVISPLPDRLEKIEERLEKVEMRLTGVEDAVKIAIPSLTKRVDRFEKKIGI